MPRKQGAPGLTERTAQSAKEDGAFNLAVWFSSADSGTEWVQNWDIKGDVLAGCLLTCMQAGLAVQFGAPRAGGAISIAVMKDGQRQPLGYANDSVEFEDKLNMLWQIAKRMVEAQTA